MDARDIPGPISDDKPLFIGQHSASSQWLGSMHSMHVFDRVLSAKEICTLTDAMLGITWWGKAKRFLRRSWYRLTLMFHVKR